MFCEHCGNLLPDRAKFCDSCGAPVKKEEPAPELVPSAPVYTPQPYGQMETASSFYGPRPSVTFLQAIELFFRNYANFSGRSRRSEYWYASLFTVIVNLLFSAILPDLTGLLTLALLVPNTAITVRRLHDIGKSGWWYFINFVPLVGGIWMLVYMCRDSEGENQWGESPKSA